MDTPLPDHIGPYRIEREIGAGGMGTVYLGRHIETGLVAAVKRLPASMAREPGFVARFTREIDALHTLSGPNIVALHDSGEDGETYYYAMEFVAGETLTERLKRENRVPWREVVEIGVQICRALKTAHNAGVIHRDLKPSNLLLAPGGVIKLTDFGVAQVFAGSKLTVTGGIIGTAEYMSPEQAQGKRATKQSDIYSLGAVMYAMLTGRPPFTGPTALDVAQKHRYGQFDSPRRIVPEIPLWLDEVVCKCLEKKPDDRYPDAYVLSLRLQEVPKKVDLKQETGGFNIDEAKATAETLAADAGRLGPAAIPGGGTLMRDLIRSQIDEARAPQSTLGRMLDNTWVLAALLLLLIGGGWLWSRSRDVSPDQLFARGRELMQRPAGAAWQTARRDYFQPLLELDPQEWEPRVAPYLEEIEIYELTRGFERTASRQKADVFTEPQRFIQRALFYWEMGDAAQAIATLNALAVLIEKDPAQAKLAERVREIIEHLQQRSLPQDERFDLLRASMERLNSLDAAEDAAEVRRLCESIIQLYSNDPDAADFVAEARRILERTADPAATRDDA